VLKQPGMRKANNPYIPLDLSRLFPHRASPVYAAVAELHEFIAGVIDAQAKGQENDLDPLQEPLAELSEQIVELTSGGMSLRRWRRRYEAALRVCNKARLALPALMTAQAMSLAQAQKIRAGIATIENLLESQWRAMQLPEPDHEDEAAAE
jgi:hypothetical protein